MNYKIIGADQKEYGPVSAVELQEWMLQGRVDLKTFVQADGESEWKPLSEFPELTTGILNVRSGGPMSRAELEACVAEKLSGIDLGGCLSRAWKLVIINLFLSVAAMFLVIITGLLINLIPFIGSVIQSVLQGVLMGGLYFFFLKLIREKRAEIGDAFAGFTNEFGQLILGGIVPGLLMSVAGLVVMVPFLFPVLTEIFQAFSSGVGINPNQINNIFSSMGGVAIGGIIIGVLLIMFLDFMWMFTLPLIIDKKLGFWDAMQVSRKAVMKNVFHLIGLWILMVLVVIGGIFACLIGIFVAVPMVFAMKVYAYEDIFTP